VFSAGVIENNPSNFIYMVWTSSICVTIGAALFLLWRARYVGFHSEQPIYYLKTLVVFCRWHYTSEEHSHLDNENEEDSHCGFHTSEQIEALKTLKTHAHGVFTRVC